MLLPLWAFIWQSVLHLSLGDGEHVLAVSQLEGRVAELREELRNAEEKLAAARARSGSGSPASVEATSAAASTVSCGAKYQSSDRLSAVAYLEEQHRLRAPFYLRSAMRSYEAGLRQLSGKDKTNDDPFIKWYEGINQVLGAIDLAPGDATTWLEAGKTTLVLAALSDEVDLSLEHAVSFMAKACRLDRGLLGQLSEWLQAASGDGAQDKLRKKIWRQHVQKWVATRAAPELPILALPFLSDGGTCALPSASARIATDQVSGGIVSDFRVRTIFPTRIMSTNILDSVPEGFAERLSKLCVEKYAEFGRQHPKANPNDLNDKFFGYQITHESQFDSAEAHARWPEMYQQSEDFKLLVRIVGQALRRFLDSTGLPSLPSDQDDLSMVLWAAVYPGNGGRHGYHVHQNSLSSCVLYLKTAGATTPITFVDPRGAPPLNDYEQHLEERDFEPTAPFHHNEYFFPDPGDLVCFPSWLVHNVPSHWQSEPRVAFAANLQGQSTWDSWFRTATGWN